MLFIVYILPYLSDGPLWHYTFIEAEYCRTNWLVGVLAINNINPEGLVSTNTLIQLLIEF